jgi:hypothetical protein
MAAQFLSGDRGIVQKTVSVAIGIVAGNGNESLINELFRFRAPFRQRVSCLQ